MPRAEADVNPRIIFLVEGFETFRDLLNEAERGGNREEDLIIARSP
jgi:hypothetical protein